MKTDPPPHGGGFFLIRTQENGIYSGKKLHGKGVFAAELFCFLGQKTDKNA